MLIYQGIIVDDPMFAVGFPTSLVFAPDPHPPMPAPCQTHQCSTSRLQHSTLSPKPANPPTHARRQTKWFDPP